MFRLSVLAILTTLGLMACTSNPYSKPLGLRFQEKKKEINQLINVRRDEKLCAEDVEDKQNCPINFYIDSVKAGSFFINNSAQYYLKPEIYNFKVKNCSKEDDCQSCDVDLQVDKLIDREFILSVDETGKPFVSNNGKPLVCTEKQRELMDVTPPTERTVTINLAADTLFKFNGSSLNDLLPKGRQEVLNVASQISNKFISVSQIKLVGHTDRLGSESYNQRLGQSRAETVRDLLLQNGVAGNIVSSSSAGKHQPVTNGCPTVKSREALKMCLQPDRRVTVEITGITK